MDASEARARLDARPRARRRQHTVLDTALVVGSPLLLYLGPVLASFTAVGVVLAVVAMFAVVTIPAVRHGRTDELVVPRSAKLWAIMAGTGSVVWAVGLWRGTVVASPEAVLLVALMPLAFFTGLLVVLYRRPSLR